MDENQKQLRDINLMFDQIWVHYNDTFAKYITRLKQGIEDQALKREIDEDSKVLLKVYELFSNYQK